MVLQSFQEALSPDRAYGASARTGTAVSLCHRHWQAPSSAGVAATLAVPALAALAEGDGGDDERGERIGPPPARERVGEQTDKQRDREVGT